MHILFALIGMVGLFYFFYDHQLKRPALAAPISLFEREVTAREFNEMVLDTSTRIPVMVDFYDPWCGPCRDFAPILADIVRNYNGAFLLARIKELTSGRGPTGVAAAAIYIASILCGDRRTQREVADVAGVTEVTIRNRYKELAEELDIEIIL